MSPQRKSDQILVAKESFSTEVEGEIYVVQKDITRVHGDHPLVKANPQFFQPVDDSVSYDVEQATAAPGKKRGQRASSPSEQAKASPEEPAEEKPQKASTSSAKAKAAK